MKCTKIIYGDGVIERAVFDDSQQALDYAIEQACLRGTYVRSQSSVSNCIQHIEDVKQ